MLKQLHPLAGELPQTSLKSWVFDHLMQYILRALKNSISIHLLSSPLTFGKLKRLAGTKAKVAAGR